MCVSVSANENLSFQPEIYSTQVWERKRLCQNSGHISINCHLVWSVFTDMADQQFGKELICGKVSFIRSVVLVRMKEQISTTWPLLN